VLSTGDQKILDFCLFEKFHKLAKPTGMKADIQLNKYDSLQKAGGYLGFFLKNFPNTPLSP
jgi:hypothetical protein